MSVALTEREALRNREPEWAGLTIELLIHAKSNVKFQAQYRGYMQRYRRALAELIAMRFTKARRVLPASEESLASVLFAVADGLAFQRFLSGSSSPEITGTMLGLVSDGVAGDRLEGELVSGRLFNYRANREYPNRFLCARSDDLSRFMGFQFFRWV